MSDPAPPLGTPVHLKGDTRRRPRVWEVIEDLGGGTVRIRLQGRPTSVYTAMYTPTSNLIPTDQEQQPCPSP